MSDNMKRLEDIRREIDQTRINRAQAVEQVLAPVIDEKRRVEMTFDTRISELEQKALNLENLIIDEVLKRQEGMKGEFLQAVYSKGRTTWDAKRLDGYALAHPEILELRKTGEPSVTIRRVK